MPGRRVSLAVRESFGHCKSDPCRCEKNLNKESRNMQEGADYRGIVDAVFTMLGTGVGQKYHELLSRWRVGDHISSWTKQEDKDF